MITVGLGEVIVDAAAITRFTRDSGGPVIADLMRRGTNVQMAARAYSRKRTRKLEKSIVKRLDVIDGYPTVRIGSDVEYAIWEHEGTRPHVITPTNRKVLRFPSGGGVVFTKRVNHPGTTGSKFLARALPYALR